MRTTVHRLLSSGSFVLCLGVVTLSACGSDDEGTPPAGTGGAGTSGQSGSGGAGKAGSGAQGGSGGARAGAGGSTAGNGGQPSGGSGQGGAGAGGAGTGGQAGESGQAGEAGAAGDTGAAGNAGAAGDAGAAGESGQAGSAGNAGSAGTAGSSGSAGAAGSGGAACTNFAGAYVGMGTCNSMLTTFPQALCLKQTACDISIAAPVVTFSGTVVGDTATAKAPQPVPQTCVAKPDGKGGVAITCSADGLSISCQGTITPVTVNDATEYCCDTVKQDCADPARRCQHVVISDQYSANACIPLMGEVPEGGSCKRISNDLQGYGRDDCAKGLLCTRFGMPSSEPMTCRKLCNTTDDCAQGQGCANDANVPQGGFCSAACDIFGASNPCKGTQTCHGLMTVLNPDGSRGLTGTCTNLGIKKEGEVCASNSECGDGMSCDFSVCSVNCDAKHPCAGGKKCTVFTPAPVAPLDPSAGFCK